MRTPPPSPSPAKRISLCFLCCYFFFLLSLPSLSSSSINALSRSLSPEKDPGPLTLPITPQSLNTHLHQCRTSTRTSNSDCEEKMDPPLISESSFSAANPSAYCLEEIWPFGAAGAGGGEPTGSGLRISQSHPGGGFGESSGNRDGGSVEESTVTEQSGAGAGRKRKDVSSEDESSKMVSTSSANDLNNTNGKRTKLTGSKYENGGPKAEAEASSMGGDKPAEQATKPSEPPKQDYIHVRARRGQATDSHSLAERARREKISERMKILQDLVPGCNKVIGKALVLDEIINYIQSLQRQVEFLSMKLEALNSRMNLNPAIEGFPSKDLGLQAYDDATGLLFGSQAPRGYAQGSPPEWLHMQIGGSFERPT